MVAVLDNDENDDDDDDDNVRWTAIVSTETIYSEITDNFSHLSTLAVASFSISSL